MNTREMEEITGVEAGTVAMWIGRRLVPGAARGRQGIKRKFSQNQILFLAVMGALAKIGVHGRSAQDIANKALAGEDVNRECFPCRLTIDLAALKTKIGIPS